MYIKEHRNIWFWNVFGSFTYLALKSEFMSLLKMGVDLVVFDDKDDASNYRPISLIDIVAKYNIINITC